MSQAITTSADIQALDYSILFDISGATASITLGNLSIASAPANLKWAFTITSPSGTAIHLGDILNPDITGNWNTPFVQSTGFPLPMGIMELGNYTIVVTVKDALGHIFSLTKTVNICRPAGNKLSDKNLFGAAIHSILTKCATSQLFVEDKSSYSYQGVIGVPVSRTFKLMFPEDNTGVAPAAFVADPFAGSALIDISVSGDGFRSFQNTVNDYSFGNFVTIRVKYFGKSVFAVHCNLDMGVLGCEIKKMIDSLQNGTCDDRDAAEDKLRIITPKFALALMGIQQPQTCIDPWALVEEIKEIGGFDCDCCIRTSGTPSTGVITGVGSLAFNTNVGGDIVASFSINGSTVTLNVHDISYVFRVDPAYTGAAFEITSSITGNTKTYTLSIDEQALAQEIVNIITSNTTLLNQLTAAVTTNSKNIQLDPKCLQITGLSTGTCDYVATIDMSLPIEAIQIKSIDFYESSGQRWMSSVGFFFDKTNLAALQARLDTYTNMQFPTDKVSFKLVAAFDAVTNKLTLTSTDNPTKLDQVQFASFNNTNFSTDNGGLIELNGVAQFIRSGCTASNSFELQVAMQALIDYLCGISACSVQTGKSLNISQLLTLAGDIQKISVAVDDPLCSSVEKLVTSFNALVDIVKGLKTTSCDTLKGVFSNTVTGPLPGTTIFYGVVDDKCTAIDIAQLAAKIMDLAKNNADINAALCQAVSSCSGPATCGAISNLSVTYSSSTQVLTAVITNTATAVKYRVEYRLVGALNTSWTNTEEIIATVGVTTTKTWTTIAAGNYEIRVTPLCTTGEGPAITGQSGGCKVPLSFNVAPDGSNFAVSFTLDSPAPDHVVLKIEYPNGSISTKNYPVTPTSFSVPVPSGTAGDVLFTLYAACDADNLWLSNPAPQVVVKVAATSSCPQVLNPLVSQITSTSFNVNADKPVASITPLSYTLKVYQGGTTNVRSQTITPVGSLLAWNVTGLLAGTLYMAEIITNMPDGSMCVTGLGQITTRTADVVTAFSLVNEGTTDATNVQVFIDGVLAASYPTIASGATVTDFTLPVTANSSIKVTACSYILTSGSITSNGGTVYSPYSNTGDALYYENVVINGDTAITFTNV